MVDGNGGRQGWGRASHVCASPAGDKRGPEGVYGTGTCAGDTGVVLLLAGLGGVCTALLSVGPKTRLKWSSQSATRWALVAAQSLHCTNKYRDESLRLRRQ